MTLFGFAGRWPGAAPGHSEIAAADPHRGCRARHLCTAEGLTVAVQGGPVWYEGVLAAEPANTVLEAYRSRGRQCIERLSGRFALAVVDRRNEMVLLAVDRVGMERLTYSASATGIVFGTSAERVATFATSKATIRPQALFDYLLLHMVPAPHTVFEGVEKLRPATLAVFEHGRVSVSRYWTPSFAEGSGANYNKLRHDLHRALESAVEDCQPGSDSGAFLSGGLDSSTVTCMLGKVTGRPPRTFSIGFGVESFNELEYARIANRRFGAISSEYDVTADDIVDAFPKIAGAFDEPFGNSSTVPTYFCAKLALSQGVNQLLAGDGGDEIFGGNERYARHRVFEAYARLPKVFRERFVEPLSQRFSADSPITPLRKFRSYVDQARIPLPERLESWNFMYRNDLATMLAPGFRTAIDPRAPFRDMAEVYASAPSQSMLHRMLYYDWHYTLSDNDLRKVGTMCELAGLRVSYPMLDPRVVDLSTQVPPRLKMYGLELRSFFRRAMSDLLPREIIAKKKHGFGLPFGVWLKSHVRLRELIYGLLSDLKGRQIVRGDFLDDLVQQHRDGHAGYFGYAIWDLAMLEAWLQAHKAAPGSLRI